MCSAISQDKMVFFVCIKGMENRGERGEPAGDFLPFSKGRISAP